MINEKNWIFTSFISFLAIHVSLQGVLPEIGSKKNDQNRFQSTMPMEVILPQDCIEACDDSGCLIFCPQPAKGVKRCASSSLDKRLCCSTDGALSPATSEPLVSLRQRRLPLRPRRPSPSRAQKSLLKLNPSLESRLAEIKNSLSNLKALHLEVLGKKKATKCKDGSFLSSCPDGESELSSEQIIQKTPPLIILPKPDKKQISLPSYDDSVSYEIYLPATSQPTENQPESQTSGVLLYDPSDNSETRSEKSLDQNNSDNFNIPTELSILQSSENLIANDFVNDSDDLRLSTPETSVVSNSDLKNEVVNDLINTDDFPTETSSYGNDTLHSIYSLEELTTEKIKTKDLHPDLTTEMNLIAKTLSEVSSTEAEGMIYYSHNPKNLVNIDSYIYPSDSAVYAKNPTKNNIENNEATNAPPGFFNSISPNSISTNTEVYVEERQSEPKELYSERNDSAEISKPFPLEYMDKRNKRPKQNQNEYSFEDIYGETVIEDKQSAPHDSASGTPTYIPESLDHYHYEIDPMNYETFYTKSVVTPHSELLQNENPSNSDFTGQSELHRPQLAEVVTPSQDLTPFVSNPDLSDPLKQIDIEQHVPLDTVHGDSPLDNEDAIILNSRGNKGTISKDNEREYQLNNNENKHQSSVNAELKSTEIFKYKNEFSFPLSHDNEEIKLYKKYEHDLLGVPRNDGENYNLKDFDVLHFEDESPDREKLLIPYSQVINLENGQHQSGQHEQFNFKNIAEGMNAQKQPETLTFPQYLNDLTKVKKNNYEFFNRPNKTSNDDLFVTKTNNYQVRSNIGDSYINEYPILKSELQKKIDYETNVELNRKQNLTLIENIDDTLLEKLYDIIKSDRMRERKNRNHLKPDTNEVKIEGNNSEIHHDHESKHSLKFDDSFESRNEISNKSILNGSTLQTKLNFERGEATDAFQSSYESTTPKNLLITDVMIGNLEDGRFSEESQTFHSNEQPSSDSGIATLAQNNKNDIDQSTWKAIDSDPYIKLTTINNEGGYVSKTSKIYDIDITTIKIPTKLEYSIENAKAYNNVDEHEKFLKPNPFLNETDKNNISAADKNIILPDANSYGEESSSNKVNPEYIFSEYIDKTNLLSDSSVEKECTPAPFYDILDEEQTLKMDAKDSKNMTLDSMISEIQSNEKNKIEELMPSNVHYNENHSDTDLSSFNNNLKISQNENSEFPKNDFTTSVIKNAINLESDYDNLDMAKLVSGESGEANNEEVINEGLAIHPVTEYYNANQDLSSQKDQTVSSTLESPDIVIGKEQTIKPTYEDNTPDTALNKDSFTDNVPLYVTDSDNAHKTFSAFDGTEKSDMVETNSNVLFVPTKTYDSLETRESPDYEQIPAEIVNIEALNKLVGINSELEKELPTTESLTEIHLLNDKEPNVGRSKLISTNTINNYDGIDKELDNSEDILYKFNHGTDTSDHYGEEIKENTRENEAIESVGTSPRAPILNNSRLIKEVSKQTEDIQDSSEINDNVFESSTTDYSISPTIIEPEKNHPNGHIDEGILETNTPLTLNNDQSLLETEGMLTDSRKFKPSTIDSSVNNLYENTNSPEDKSTQFLDFHSENQITSTIGYLSLEPSVQSSSDGIVPKAINFLTASKPPLDLEEVRESLETADDNSRQKTVKRITEDYISRNEIFTNSSKNKEHGSYQNQSQNVEPILDQNLNQSSQVNIGSEIEAHNNPDEIYIHEQGNFRNINAMTNMDNLNEKSDSFSNYQHHKINAKDLHFVPLTTRNKLESDTSQRTPDSFFDDSEAFRKLNVLYKGEVYNKNENVTSNKNTEELQYGKNGTVYSLNPTSNNHSNTGYARQAIKQNSDTDKFEGLKYKIPIDSVMNGAPEVIKNYLETDKACSCDSSKRSAAPDVSNSGHLIGNIIKSVNPKSPIYIFVDKSHSDSNTNLLPILHQKELANINEKDHAISIRQIESPKPKYRYEFVNGQYVRVLQNEHDSRQDEYYDDRSFSGSQLKSSNNQEILSALDLENPSESLVNLNNEYGITKHDTMHHETQSEQQSRTENPILVDSLANIQDLLYSSETNSNHKHFNGKEYYVPVPIYIYIRSK